MPRKNSWGKARANPLGALNLFKSHDVNLSFLEVVRVLTPLARWHEKFLRVGRRPTLRNRAILPLIVETLKARMDFARGFLVHGKMGTIFL